MFRFLVAFCCVIGVAHGLLGPAMTVAKAALLEALGVSGLDDLGLACPAPDGASQCHRMFCHDENPFVSSCLESDVAWESEVVTSLLTANGTQFDYSDLLVRASSSTGGCVSSCGTISSTETSSVTGEPRDRELSLFFQPPIFVFSATLAGALPDRAHGFTSTTCDISAKTLIASSGRNQTGVYKAAIDAAVVHAEEAGGRRRLESTGCPDASVDAGARRLAKRLEPCDASEDCHPEWLRPNRASEMPLHHSVADAHLLSLMRMDRAASRVHALSKHAPSSVKSRGASGAQLMSPDAAIYSQLKGLDTVEALKSLPSIDPDVWDAALEVVFGEREELLSRRRAWNDVAGTAWDPENAVAFRVALVMQQSRNAHLKDLYGDDTASRPMVTGGVVWGNVTRSLYEDMVSVHAQERHLAAMRHPRKLVVGAVLGAAALVVAGVALDQSLKNADKINEIVDKLDVMDSVMEANAELAKASQRTAEASLAEAEAVQDAFVDIQRNFECVEALAAAVSESVLVNTDRIEELGDEVVAIQEAQNAGFSAAAAERAALFDGLAATAAASQQGIETAYADLTEAIQTTADFLKGEIDTLRHGTETFVDSISNDLKLTTDQVTINTRSIRNLASAVYEVSKMNDARRRVTRVFHMLRGQIEQFYWRPFLEQDTLDNLVDPDPESWWRPGSPRRRLHIDTLSSFTVRRGDGFSSDVYGGGANHKLRQDKLAFYCDADVMMKLAMPWWTAKDLLLLLGENDDCAAPAALGTAPGINTQQDWVDAFIQPDGSSTWNPEGKPLCKCWFEVQALECPIALSSDTERAVTRGSDIDTSRHIGKNGLVPIIVTTIGGGLMTVSHDPCGGAPVSAIPEATRVIASQTNYTAFMRDVCHPPNGRDLSHLPPSAFKKLPGDVRDAVPLSVSVSTSSRLSSVLSDIGYVVAVGSPYVNASMCGTDSTTLAHVTTNTPASTFELFIKNSWKDTFDDLRLLDMHRYGSMGGDVKVHASPFNFDVPTGKTFSCQTVEFVGLQGGMQPVYRLRPQGVVKRAEAWMAPVEPSSPGAADGRPAVYYSTDDPELIVDMSFMVPSDFVFVGDPECMFRECSRPAVRENVNVTAIGADEEARFLFDIPQGDLSLNPDPTVRVGTMSYLLFTNTTTDPETGDYPPLDPSFRYTLDMWKEQNVGEAFDVTAAGADISMFLRELEETAGGNGAGDVTCKGLPGAGDGSLCSLLQHFYFLEPSFTINPVSGKAEGAHAYLADSPAAACATPGSGVFCLVPRVWSEKAVPRVPVGQISQTIGSVCPDIRDELLVHSGLPTLELYNGGKHSVEFRYDWTFRGPNPARDSPNAQTLWDQLKVGDPGAPHPCYGRQLTNIDGGVISSKSSINLQAAIGDAVQLCADWTLTLRIPDPATALYSPCATHNISINNINMVPAMASSDDLTFINEVRLDVDDTAAQVALDAVGDATSSVITDQIIFRKYVESIMPGSEAGFEAFKATIAGYTPPPTLGELASNFSGQADAVRAREASRLAAADAAIAASKADAAAFSEKAAVSRAQLDAAMANFEAMNDILNTTVAIHAARVDAVADAVAEQKNATDYLVWITEVNSNITIEHVDTAIAGVFRDIPGAVANAVGEIAEHADEALDMAKGLFGLIPGIPGFLANILNFLFYVAIVCGIAFGIYSCWRCGLCKQCCSKQHHHHHHSSKTKLDTGAPYESQPKHQYDDSDDDDDSEHLALVVASRSSGYDSPP